MNKYSSLIGQILQFFLRVEFEQAVKKTGSEFHAKGFTRWQQFVAMMFCQLGQAHSLREICQGLQSCLGKLKHPGIEEAPKRSTLLCECSSAVETVSGYVLPVAFPLFR